MKSFVWLAAAFLVAGCAALSPPAEKETVLIHDSLFAPPARPVRAADVFAMSDEMRRYLHETVGSEVEAKGRERALYDALYARNQLRLEYDAEMTRNAAEAFAVRSGNCLSLAIMTASFAKELGLTVRFNRVFSDESWTRAGDLLFASGHVNVTLGRKNPDPRVLFQEKHVLTIDFINSERKPFAYEVGEQTITAMYMNNRAAELLSRGKLDDAYWHAREAIFIDPKFTGSLNTLGVIYRRHGNDPEAERVFRYALAREPANAHAMANLVTVLQDMGRKAEADALAAKLAALEPNPPFHFFNLGMDAIRAGDFARARDYFKREIARDSYNHEFHFWLAMAYYGLGDAKQAREHLQTALENSNTRSEHDLYAAKLDRLRALPR